MAPTSVTLQARVVGANGTIPTGTITASNPPTTDTATGLPTAQVGTVLTLDANGEASASVTATTDPTTEPNGAEYVIVEAITVNSVLKTRTYRVRVPYDTPGGVIELAALAPVADANLGYVLRYRSVVYTGKVLKFPAQTGNTVAGNVADQGLGTTAVPALAAGAVGTLTITDAKIGTASIIMVSIRKGTTAAAANAYVQVTEVQAPGSGSVVVALWNPGAANLLSTDKQLWYQVIN